MTDRMLQFFVPNPQSELGYVTAQFTELACWIVDNLPSNPERTVALRKLLEAQDAAVRAKLFRDG